MCPTLVFDIHYQKRYLFEALSVVSVHVLFVCMFCCDDLNLECHPRRVDASRRGGRNSNFKVERPRRVDASRVMFQTQNEL